MFRVRMCTHSSHTFTWRRRLLYNCTQFHLLRQGQNPVTKTPLMKPDKAWTQLAWQVHNSLNNTQDAVLGKVQIIPPLFLTAETRFIQGLAPIFPAKDILKLALFTLTNKNNCFSGNCWEIHSLETENEIRISRNPALNFLNCFFINYLYYAHWSCT